MQSPNSCTRDGLMTRFLSGTGKKSTPSRFQCKQRDGGGIRLSSSSDLAVPTFSDRNRLFMLTLIWNRLGTALRRRKVSSFTLHSGNRQQLGIDRDCARPVRPLVCPRPVHSGPPGSSRAVMPRDGRPGLT